MSAPGGRSGSLALHVELRLSAPPAGSAALVNTGQAPVRVWRQGNSWGDPTLSFLISAEGVEGRVVRSAQEYTRNVPATIELRAGERHAWAVDLADGSWEAEPSLDRLARPGGSLVGVYEVVPTAEAEQHNVWIGRILSEPVRLADEDA